MPVNKSSKVPSRAAAKKTAAKAVPSKKLTAAEFRKRDDARRDALSAKQKQARLDKQLAAEESRRNLPPQQAAPTKKGFFARLTERVVRPEMICPHCGRKGCVRAGLTRRTVSISGGKVTTALLTGGLSIFATGLSQKEWVTKADCDNCGCRWNFC